MVNRVCCSCSNRFYNVIHGHVRRMRNNLIMFAQRRERTYRAAQTAPAERPNCKLRSSVSAAPLLTRKPDSSTACPLSILSVSGIACGFCEIF